MAWLASRKLAISLDDLDAFVSGTRAARRDAVVVTVDDGDPCVLSRAWPIARGTESRSSHSFPRESSSPTARRGTTSRAPTRA